MSSDKEYDLFLFYHPDDLNAVEYLAQRLLAVGITLFFDLWHLIAGSPLQESLEKALDGSQSVAVFLGPGGAAWEDQEMNDMVGQRVRNGTLHFIPVLLPKATKRGNMPWVEFRESVDNTEAFEELVSRIRAVAPAPDLEVQSNSNNHAPEEEVQMYTAETEQLIEKLKTTRFAAVLGPSDSDKSSIVLDGLIPALQKGALPDSQNWREPIIFTPTAQPLQELAKQLVALLSGGSVRDISHINQFRQALKTHDTQLHLSVRLALRKMPRAHRLLLVVNQFEELFTLCQDAHIRQQFLANLLYASGIEGGRVIVILIMQEDFLVKCADDLELAEPLSTSNFSIRQMEAIKFKQIFECMGKFQPVDPNPYVVGLPIDPNAGTPFVGRQDIIDWIKRNLQSAQKPILVLYGQRRMGKTSVLRQIEKGVQGKELREELDRPVYPVYINLQGLTDWKTHAITIAKNIAKTVRKRNLTCADPIEKQFSHDPYAALNQFLDAVELTIKNGRLLLMLDEFEELENEKNKEIFSYFRSQMEHRDSIAFLLTGGNRLEEIYRNDFRINFKNVLNREVTFLERSDATKLIRDPVRPIVIYNDEAIDKIWFVTQGHPYFIQFLCREILKEMNKHTKNNYISATDVNQATKRVIDQGDQELHYLWDRSDRIEQDILKTMAKLLNSGNPYLKFYKISNLLTRTKTSLFDTDIDKALGRLVARRIIKKSDSKLTTEVCYFYSFDLLRQWISHKHLPSTVRP